MKEYKLEALVPRKHGRLENLTKGKYMSNIEIFLISLFGSLYFSFFNFLLRILPNL